MLEKMAFGRIYGSLVAENFYHPHHQDIFRAMLAMYETSTPIDLLTVQEWLVNRTEKKTIADQDIAYTLVTCTRDVVSSAHLEYHAYLIREMWQRLEIARLKHDRTDDTDPRTALNDITDQIRRITGTNSGKDWVGMDEVMYNLIQHQVEYANGKHSFIRSGIPSIDGPNGGFYPGQMIVIGARPSVGKSAFMGQMALDIAKQGKTVGIITLEMNNTEIAARLASIETDISFSQVFRDIASDETLHRAFYERISRSTIHLPIYFSDKTKVNATEIKAKATKLKATHGLDLLMIDYLQLIDGATSNKQYNREQEVAKMSREIKLMAKELEVPVIVLCQLNRSVTSRGYNDRFPKLSDLRESGSIEQDSDVVMFIHRDYMSGWETKEDGSSSLYEADLIVAKWRNGATMHVPMDFDPPRMRFKERYTQSFTPISSVRQSNHDDNPF